MSTDWVMPISQCAPWPPHVSRETLPPPEMLPVFELHLLHFHDGVRVRVRVRVRIAVPGKAR